MSGAPPPYPGNPDDKGAPYPPPPQQYDPPQTGYPPPQPFGAPQAAGYGPPPAAAGYGPPPPAAGYGPPPPGAYPPQSHPGYPPPNKPGQGYAPQPGYQTHGQQHSTVVVAQPPVTLVQTFQSTPVRTVCPHCRAEIVTATHFESGTFSWVMCVIICLLGCDLGCCLIPFCVEGCQDVIHSCPNCHQHVARWSRM